MQITLPTIHINGTSRDNLRAGYDNAADKLVDFITAYGSIEFNARDYYVQGPDAYTSARDLRDAMNAKIRDIREYLDAHREHLWS